MAPLKHVRSSVTSIVTRNATTQKTKPSLTSTRNSRIALVGAQPRPKRKAESPVKDPNVKRKPLGDRDLNKRVATIKPVIKGTAIPGKVVQTVKTVSKSKHKNNENAVPQAPHLGGMVTRGAVHKHVPTTNQTAIKPKEPLKDNSNNANRIKTRLSNEFEKTEDSLYTTASSDVAGKTEAPIATPEDSPSYHDAANLSSISTVATDLATKLNLGDHDVPGDVDNFDKENWDDPYQVSHYAMDIFNYLKTRELLFEIKDYMDRQVCLTSWMRSLLVDWMVEVQESFELNHETLYLGVKLVDMYLTRMTVGKETLQLVGAAAMFVASKYDERIPPQIDDFLYICDGAYTRKELIRMEINLLKVCDFNLGIPISYRFLRRYARCGRVTMPILTLARFVLECSLMDYATVTVRDSKLAAASLYLALRMKDISGWTSALQFYSGYQLQEFIHVVFLLNNGLHRKPKSPLMTVRNKYSHKIFFEVAKIPLLKNEDLV